MKKIILLFLFATSIHAQTIEISGGYTTSSLDLIIDYDRNGDGNYNKYYIYPESMTSLNLGIGVEYLNKSFYSINSNIYYIRKGGYSPNASHTDGSPTHNRPNEYGYLDLVSFNTMFRLKADNKYFTPFLEVGPRVDFLANMSEAFLPGNHVGSVGEEGLSPIDFYYGLDISSGIYSEFNHFRVGVKFTYNYTHNSFYEFDPRRQDHLKARMKSFTLNFTVGYTL